HAPRRHREPQRRARAGRRADDGRLRADRPAGPRAPRLPPALLHRRTDGGKREGMKQKAEGRRQKWGMASAVVLTSAFCLLPSALAQPPSAWTSHPADGVEMHLTREGEVNRLDFDF